MSQKFYREAPLYRYAIPRLYFNFRIVAASRLIV